MESKRQHQYNSQIQKDLSEIFQRDSGHFFLDNLVSIMGVKTAPDLSVAKIYFSVFPVNQDKKVLENLNEKKNEVRWRLGKKIGKSIRKIPELAFFIDDTVEEASRMDQIINHLNIPPKKT